MSQQWTMTDTEAEKVLAALNVAQIERAELADRIDAVMGVSPRTVELRREGAGYGLLLSRLERDYMFPPEELLASS